MNKNLVEGHFLIVKNAYRTKCTLSPTIPPQTLPPSLLPHPTTTHEYIGAYFIQFPPPGWLSVSHDDSNEVLKSFEK